MPNLLSDILEGRRILVADGTEQERKTLIDYLQQRGARVCVATNGKEAFNKALSVIPDVVLMELRLPVWDGLTCCRMMQANLYTSGIPVVFLTTASSPQERVQGLTAGAVDYIVKPCSLEEIGLRIVIHLRRNSLSRSTAESVPDSASNLNSILFQSARQVLLHSLARPPELQLLAESVGTNTKRLNEAFRQCVGSTVFEYLREERMKEACFLLAGTGLSIQDIAVEIGFTNGANFSTAFRERFGLSPRQYRQSRLNHGRD